jgi:hypothetical protein
VAAKNANLPIEVTLFGMVIEVSEVALKNAELPIEVTLFGITADTQPELSVTTFDVIVKVPPPVQFTSTM